MRFKNYTNSSKYNSNIKQKIDAKCNKNLELTLENKVGNTTVEHNERLCVK